MLPMRAVAIIMAVMASLLCASCGGGGSGASSDAAAVPSASAATPPASSAPGSAPASSSSPSPSATPPSSSPAPATTSTAPAPSTSAPSGSSSSSGSNSNSNSNSSNSSDSKKPPPPVPPFTAHITYRIVEIPRLTAAGTMTAHGVNNQGIVVGDYQAYCIPDCSAPGQTSTGSQAWMYEQKSGALDELTLESSEQTASAYGINNKGTIAGEAATGNGPQGVLWKVTGGVTTLPGNLYASFDWAVAINDGGTVLGQYENSGNPGSAAFLWTPPGDSQTPLPGPECDYCNQIGRASCRE